MTAKERSEIAVLIEMVGDMKSDLGELRAEVRALQTRSGLRGSVVTLCAAVIGAAGYVLHTFFGFGRSS